MSTDRTYRTLLWPFGRESRRIPDQTWEDLGLSRIVAAVTVEKRRADAIEAIMRQLPLDTETVAYRIAVTRDLLNVSELGDAFVELVPIVEELRYFTFRPDRYDWTPLQEVTWRIRELEYYVALLDLLHCAFSAAGDRAESEGLRGLQSMVSAARESAIFARVREELPGLLAAVVNFRSIAVGINLSGGLEPIEATILAVGDTPYRGDGLAGRILGGTDHTGIARLHSAVAGETAANPLLVPLFRDLSEIMQRAVKPLAATLSEFVGFNTRNLVAIADELHFYAGIVRLARRIDDVGLPLCTAELVRAEGAACVGGSHAAPAVHAESLYNLDLAIRRLESAPGSSMVAAVASDVSLDHGESIAIVTGPNGGGKTTFLQAVGLAQLLSQLGFFSPARRMTLDLVDTVLTHYPALERMDEESGRFAEEANRLHELLAAVTPSSLVLLNETLSSTAMGEAVYIARDVLALFTEVSCRVVFVTHLHSLAAEPGTDAVSLVAGISEVDGVSRPTYRISRGQPEGRSYAVALAGRYGLDLAGMRESIAARAS